MIPGGIVGGLPINQDAPGAGEGVTSYGADGHQHKWFLHECIKRYYPPPLDLETSLMDLPHGITREVKQWYCVHCRLEILDEME